MSEKHSSPSNRADWNINDLMSQMFHIGEHHGPLLHAEAMQNLIDAIAEGKFNITVLREVFMSFYESSQTKLAPIDFSFRLLDEAFQKGERSRIPPFPQYFDYNERKWKATVVHTVTPYTFERNQEKMTYFINIKLPNDGYYYTPKYATNDDNDGLDIANAETNQLLQCIFATLGQHFLADDLFGEFGALRPYYRRDESRVDLYFWNKTFDKCVTVKWENGFHETSNFKNKEAKEAADRRTRPLVDRWNSILRNPIELAALTKKHTALQAVEDTKLAERQQTFTPLTEDVKKDDDDDDDDDDAQVESDDGKKKRKK